MKLIALMPARNEQWVIGLSARVALAWCDELLVLEHCCTDETDEILCQVAAEHPGRIGIMREENPVWREMAHRQRLLEAARARGASHIAIVDADEVLTGNLLPGIREAISRLPAGRYLMTRMLAMWRGIEQYRDDQSVWSNRRDLVLAFADGPRLRWARGDDGYDHHRRAPIESTRGVFWGAGGGTMHLEFADWPRLAAKHAHYKMTERLRWPQRSITEVDAQYNLALDESRIAYTSAPAAWWQPYQHLLHHLRLGEVPWQAEEAQRLYVEYGPEKFSGLNLFGVVREGKCQPV